MSNITSRVSTIANRMTTLLDKIEQVLGTDTINLPEDIGKNMWGDPDQKGPIPLFTLPTFSRYFPNMITVTLDYATKTRDGWYLLDESIGIPDGVTIIGVRDINWQNYDNGLAASLNGGYGIYVPYSAKYSLDDVMMAQAMANVGSMFGNANNIFVEYKEPNLCKLVGAAGIDMTRSVSHYPVDVFIEHNLNLMTISPTKMETFEALATADVARFLYKKLLRNDNLDTIFANVDLKLDDIQREAEKREDIIASMKEGYVSAANENQPLMFSI